MSATVEGAMKALLESLGMGLAAYRDTAPPKAPLPYLIVSGIADPFEPSGDFGSAAAVPEVRTQLDVSLWQAIENVATGAHSADDGLAHRVAKAIRGRVLQNVQGGRCYPLKVDGVARTPSFEKNVQRESISVSIVRQVGG